MTTQSECHFFKKLFKLSFIVQVQKLRNQRSLFILKSATMKRLILYISLAAMALGLNSCYREENIRPQDPIREYSFIEDFNDDRNGWSFADPANLAYGVVSNGTFKFDYNDDYSESYYVAQNFGFNPNRDFTISSKLGSDNMMGILFGYNENNGAYGYTFTIDYDGYFALYDEGGNGYGSNIAALVTPRTNNRVNINGDWNVLTIEQRGNRWYGYVNDYQVFDISAQRIRGKGVGFMDVARTRGEVDYLDVYWYQ